MEAIDAPAMPGNRRIRRRTPHNVPTAVELGRIIRAARLRHEQGLTQEEIAERMHADQGRVSKWLARAEELDLLVTRVHAPAITGDLSGDLCDRLPSFRDIVVTPPGPDKNVENLGEAAADVLIDAILTVQERKRASHAQPRVSITWSNGVTLRRAAERFVERIRDDPSLQKKIVAHLDFYPAAVFWQVEIKDFYPISLVTTLWTQLASLLPGRVHAFVPVLPRSYYTRHLWKTKGREWEEVLAESGATEKLRDAGNADIMMLGIGLLDDPIYWEILEATEFEGARARFEGVRRAELIYVPLKDEHGIRERMVRVDNTSLVAAARDPDRFCIGVGGGSLKLAAVTEVLEADPPVINTLVTCTEVAGPYVETHALPPPQPPRRSRP